MLLLMIPMCLEYLLLMGQMEQENMYGHLLVHLMKNLYKTIHLHPVPVSTPHTCGPIKFPLLWDKVISVILALTLSPSRSTQMTPCGMVRGVVAPVPAAVLTILHGLASTCNITPQMTGTTPVWIFER